MSDYRSKRRRAQVQHGMDQHNTSLSTASKLRNAELLY